METGNVDVVLMRITANECNAATEDLRAVSRHRAPGHRRVVDRERAIAALLNDMSNECLTRSAAPSPKPPAQHI